MELKLYTFIMDYKGGTYVSQTHAKDHLEAKNIWAQSFNLLEVPGMNEQSREQLINEANKEELTPLDGLINAWYLCVYFGNETGYINIIETVK